jgi:hypothetical protein
MPAVYCSSSRRRLHRTPGRREGHPPLLPVGDDTRQSLWQWRQFFFHEQPESLFVEEFAGPVALSEEQDL